MSDLIDNAITAQIQAHKVILYMKGTPYAPKCGFSARVVDILMNHQLDLGYVDVLEYPEIRQCLPEHSGWPTFPQIFIDKELIGGCDILCEMEKSGELAKLIAQKKLLTLKKITDATQEIL